MSETLEIQKKTRWRIRTGDFALVVLVAILVVFGVIMVFSASYYSSINESGDPYEYLKSDLMWAAIGTAGMVLCALCDYHIYVYLALPGLVISFVLLGLIFTSLGVNINNATRWLGVEGFPVTIMPGELAKAFAILFVSWYFAKYPKRIHSFFKGILPMVLLAGAYFILIFKQPNLSTALTVVGIIVLMLFVAGMHWGYLAGALGALGCGIAWLLTAGKETYWYTRLTGFTDPFADRLGDGWQVVQSLLGLASGGVKGVGLGNSVAKALYLPEPQTDFILAIIGEELGFIGCFLLVLVYVLLIWRCCRIAINAPDFFGTMIASGITIMLTLQVILNIAVVTSTMPPTGIALPFISYGGNSLIIFMGCMGILLNISRQSERYKEQAEDAQ